MAVSVFSKVVIFVDKFDCLIRCHRSVFDCKLKL